MRTREFRHAIACKAACFCLLIAGNAAVMPAQTPQPPSVAANPQVLLASAASIPNGASTSSSDSAASTEAASLQPPPRRYGRPSYTDKNSNPDGSPKYTFFAGVGGSVPIGNTHAYETPGYSFQVGAGRNFNQTIGVMFQFDYDHFGLQAATIANQEYIYNYPSYEGGNCTSTLASEGFCVTSLDGNNHVWSFTLNPKFTIPTTGILGAYAVVGGGFYHKVTNFTQPTTAEQCGIYGCGYFAVDANVAHYTSNAGGVNGGIGFTSKMSEFSTRQVYLEARYVLILNQQRPGYTAQNVATTSYTGYDAYPANSHRTTYIHITFGFRF